MNQKTKQLHFHKPNGTFWARRSCENLFWLENWNKHDIKVNTTAPLALRLQNHFPHCNPAGWQLKMLHYPIALFLIFTNYQPGMSTKDIAKWKSAHDSHLWEMLSLRKWKLRKINVSMKYFTISNNNPWTVNLKMGQDDLLHVDMIYLDEMIQRLRTSQIIKGCMGRI